MAKFTAKFEELPEGELWEIGQEYLIRVRQTGRAEDSASFEVVGAETQSQPGNEIIQGTPPTGELPPIPTQSTPRISDTGQYFG